MMEQAPSAEECNSSSVDDTSRDETRNTNTQTASATSRNESVHIQLNNSAEENRYCWVCFATDDDDEFAEWVHPCVCIGTIRWVHQTCLQRWVDEKQKGNSTRLVSCPQCQTEYIIVFPPMGTITSIMESVDTMIKRLSPFLAAGIMVGSFYWTAVT